MTTPTDEAVRAAVERLLPCPFCGGKPDFTPLGKENACVACPECEIEIWCGTDEAVIRCWNTRAPSSPTEAAPVVIEPSLLDQARARLEAAAIADRSNTADWLIALKQAAWTFEEVFAAAKAEAGEKG